ncbi:MAG: hypothetical protein HYZ63_01855 [Candidatus Andersenbacteria bacterium]|nr:hypothetical protein [Candidatus Andersenbacteria bacterium]
MWDKLKLFLAGLCMATLVGIACGVIFLLFLITSPLQRVVMKWRQIRAKIWIPASQRKMLNQLWQADLLQRRLNSAYCHGDWGAGASAISAFEDANVAAAKCLKAGIAQWRVDAFRIDSHDYWWSILSSDHWAGA